MKKTIDVPAEPLGAYSPYAQMTDAELKRLAFDLAATRGGTPELWAERLGIPVPEKK